MLEWLFVAMLLLGAIWLASRKWRSSLVWAGAAAFLVLSGAGLWLWQGRLVKQTRARAELSEKLPRQGHPGGYVTSERCQACHPQQYQSWHRSFHRTMTQVATPETARARFEGTLHLANESYQLEQRGGEFWVEMVDPDWKYVQLLREQAALREGKPVPPADPNPPRSRKRVGMMTGSHHMHAFWVPSQYGNEQFSFPFTWLFEENRWVPRNDVFLMDPGKPHLQQVWNVNCIRCHVTAGQPRQDAKTHVIDSRIGEMGIGCESCHGPSEEHVRANENPRRRYALHAKAEGDQTIVNPRRQSARKSSETCGQCHGITRILNHADWVENGFRFRPGGEMERDLPLIRHPARAPAASLPKALLDNRALWEGSFWPDGMVRVSGREYNGLIESPCHQRGELSCLSCHSMHQSQPDDQLAAGMESNQACLPCHGSIQLTEHTRHRADSSGSLCYNCHMPHTTYGLLKAMRSHEIDSPSVQATVQTGRPNACTLCHLDQTLGWTAKYLSDWYGIAAPQLSSEEQSVSAAALLALRGDAGQRALIAWHLGWEPAQEISGREWMAPYLAQLLEDPYSAVRYIAQRSLKRLPGYRDLTFDYISPAPERSRARQRALEIWNARANKAVTGRDAVLVAPDGALQEEKFTTLLQRRNNRLMELLE